MNPQQKRREREKDCKRKREKREKATNKKKKDTDREISKTCGFPSLAAKRMALSRLWSRVPTDPEKFADIVEDFLSGKHTSPRKKAALARQGLGVSGATSRRKLFELMTSSLKRKVQELKIKKDSTSLRDRRLLISAHLISKKYRMQNMLAKELDVRSNYVSRLTKSVDENNALTFSRKKRSDATSISVIEKVQRFYCSPKVSRELPYMRTVKNNTQRRVMEVSIEQAYNMFKEENKDETVLSDSLFQKLKPSNVLLQHKTKLSQCLCSYCTDILLKLQTLNKIAQAYSMPELKIKDKYKLIEMSLCPKENKYHDLQCINRSCEKCGNFLLRQHLSTMTSSNHGDAEVQWLKWTTQQYVQDGKTKSKQIKITQRGRISELIEELLNETANFAKHLFVANWQQDMFTSLSHKLPQKWVLLVLDFAQNYSCLNQDEIQSAHWAIKQVTLHPVVAYYNCVHGDTLTHIAQEALVFISEDLRHDFHAVHHFEERALKYLQEDRGLKINQVVEFTDGAGSQYKSRGPFADISFSKTDYDIEFQRNFFGSRHGKGPSDGVSGVVKSAVRRAVISRKAIINSAADMFVFCEKNLCKDSCTEQRRSIFFVRKDETIRTRPERNVKTAIPGTRAIHVVKCVQSGVIATRSLACFCDGCLSNQLSKCVNAEHTTPWKVNTLKMAVEPRTNHQNLLDTGNASSIVMFNAPQNQSGNMHLSHDKSEVEAEETIQDLFKQLQSEYSETNVKPGDEVASTSENDVLDISLTLSDIIKTLSPLDNQELYSHNGAEDDNAKLEINVANSPKETSCVETKDIECGDFVAVIFDDKWWPGEIKTVGEDTFIISFLTPKGNNRFIWPTQTDEAEINKSGIFTLLPSPPVPINNRHLGFDPEVAKDVTARVVNYLRSCEQ